ncbi:MAG: alpha/beta fold hydrolase [Marinibacterium sp.]|nr:alpha/beta fold hydrolase [Marinibacterium sp.]
MTAGVALHPDPPTHEGIAGRLICFAPAGGGDARFHDWMAAFAPVLDVRAVTLPGRGRLMDLAPPSDLSAVIGAITDRIQPLSDRPMALFGHSFGALLAYEAARRLEAAGAPPQILVVAGRAPQMALPSRISALPRAAFLREVAAMQGTPPEVLSDAGLMDRILPALRADFGLYESYDSAAATSHAPLSCPILAFGGDDDPQVPLDAILGWRHRTRRRFESRIFAGDHFFAFTNPQVADALFDQVDGALNEHSKGIARAG